MLRRFSIIPLFAIAFVFSGCSAENNILSYSGDSILSVQSLLDDPVYDQTISITGWIDTISAADETITLADGEAQLQAQPSERTEILMEDFAIGDKVLLIGVLQRGFVFGAPVFEIRNIRVIQAATVTSDPGSADTSTFSE